MASKFVSKAPAKTVGGTIWIVDTDNINTITEVGLLSASSAGTMLIRRVLAKPVVMTGLTKGYMVEVEYVVEDL